MSPPGSEPAGASTELPPDVELPPPPPPMASPPAVEAPAAAQVVSACREQRLVGCENVYIRVLKSAPDLCVQLVLNNCGEGGRNGLRVTTPFTWTLASGSASTNPECELAEYEPTSEPALEGSGDISWLEEGSVISDVQFRVQLELSPAPESTVPALIDVATEEALGDIADCE